MLGSVLLDSSHDFRALLSGTGWRPRKKVGGITWHHQNMQGTWLDWDSSGGQRCWSLEAEGAETRHTLTCLQHFELVSNMRFQWSGCVAMCLLNYACIAGTKLGQMSAMHACYTICAVLFIRHMTWSECAAVFPIYLPPGHLKLHIVFACCCCGSTVWKSDKTAACCVKIAVSALPTISQIAP